MMTDALRATRAWRAAPRLSGAGVALVGLALLLAWDASGLDLPLAMAVGGPDGFPWREHWLLTTVLHGGARWLSWLLAVGLCVAVWWPVGPLARVPQPLRLQLAVSTLAAAFAVTLLKGLSTTSCPWDLQLFGGVARLVSHWRGVADGGPGHCFPAGHAASGFSFIAGWFALRRHEPRIAVLWLVTALAAGMVLGVSQQLRGAHFLSHTLWTAWICWTLCWALDGLHRKFAAGET